MLGCTFSDKNRRVLTLSHLLLDEDTLVFCEDSEVGVMDGISSISHVGDLEKRNQVVFENSDYSVSKITYAFISSLTSWLGL